MDPRARRRCRAGLTGAAPALGAQRYAAPGEIDTTPCTQLDPCSIDSAIENAVAPDEVIVKQGLYSVSDILLVVPGTNVHGEAGAPRSRVTSGENLTMGGDTGTGTTRVAHLKIENTTSGGGALAISGGTAEDIVAETTSAIHTCLVEQATLRDSTCWTSGSGGTAVDSTQPGASNLRNVTAVAEGVGSAGIAVSSFDPPGGQVVIDAKNVIADGFTDVTATTDSVLGDSADVTLSYSQLHHREHSRHGRDDHAIRLRHRPQSGGPAHLRRTVSGKLPRGRRLADDRQRNNRRAARQLRHRRRAAHPGPGPRHRCGRDGQPVSAAASSPSRFRARR